MNLSIAENCHSSGHDLEQAKKYIDDIDFSMIIHKMVKEKGWLQRDAVELSQQYRRFLFLQKKYDFKSQQLPPSEEIDEFWHNHILDTRKYREDCQVIFGEYFDHYPYFGIDGTDSKDIEKAFNHLLELYFTEFGERLYEVRTWYSKLVGFLKLKFRKKPRRGEQNWEILEKTL